ncbi:hypothetical protein NDU88_003941 [Pleurodeles waltl]|uniref:Uncharacterized protein n=1 Tax=Pleurodeles waltl TaxID=8319 RepID=A0AAV7SHC9_PLEWA|nr:hypothetical protein NDU88_003941 [Pleurodeles waltl]
MRGTEARARLAERSWQAGVWKGDDQLGVGCVGYYVDVVQSRDVGEGSHVNVEKSWAEGGSLRDATDDFGGFGQVGRKADSLGSAGEERGDPVEGLAMDPGVVEACLKGVVTDVSKSAERSKRIRAAVLPLSSLVLMSSVAAMSAVSVLWFL